MLETLVLKIGDIMSSDNNINLYVYPNCESKNGEHIPKKNSTNKLETLDTFLVTETYFRDLIKIETTTKNVTTSKYAKKKSYGETIENCFLVSTKYEEIHPNNFPNSDGHHITKKIIKIFKTKYETLNIVSHNNTLFIEIKEIPTKTSHKKKLKEEINSAIKEFF